METVTLSERVFEHNPDLAKQVAKLEGKVAQEAWYLFTDRPMPAPRDGETATILVSRGVHGHKAALFFDVLSNHWASGRVPTDQKELVHLGYDRWRLIGPAIVGGES